MVAVTDYQELDIWKDAMDLCEQVYEITTNLPVDEKYGLVVQMRRASISIPSNIAEGFVRKHGGDFRRFLSFAIGSLAELNTQLMLARRLNFVADEDMGDIFEKVSHLSKMITKFYRGVRT